MTRYFTKRQASAGFVYNDVLNYRRKFKPDAWKIAPEKTKVARTPEGGYIIDLEGMFSYHIRNPMSGNGYRERYVHNQYVVNREYKIMAVWEVKDGK